MSASRPRSPESPVERRPSACGERSDRRTGCIERRDTATGPNAWVDVSHRPALDSLAHRRPGGLARGSEAFANGGTVRVVGVVHRTSLQRDSSASLVRHRLGGRHHSPEGRGRQDPWGLENPSNCRGRVPTARRKRAALGAGQTGSRYPLVGVWYPLLVGRKKRHKQLSACGAYSGPGRS